MLFEDKVMEECGVVGVYSTSQEVSKLAFFALSIILTHSSIEISKKSIRIF